ncbi:MAG TPA: glucosamine-6-phosphate deaminase [bacterium]|nr:glucosamine-6-phosphate deaminase [bacterium]
MEIIVCKDKAELGRKAAADGAALIRKALKDRGSAFIILATGASQFEMLAALRKEKDIDWSKVTGFHLDEYVGLPVTHPASFRLYLRERFVKHVPMKEFHYINGEGDAAAECKRVGAIIRRNPIDVAFVGIGENGHIAFNDPPADFATEEPYLVVDLDEACRRQQMGEGWFKTLEEVPPKAISMSVNQIMKSRSIICACPDARKAKAVKMCLEGPVTPTAPSSIMQQHEQAFIYLDPDSAALLEKK